MYSAYEFMSMYSSKASKRVLWNDDYCQRSHCFAAIYPDFVMANSGYNACMPANTMFVANTDLISHTGSVLLHTPCCTLNATSFTPVLLPPCLAYNACPVAAAPSTNVSIHIHLVDGCRVTSWVTQSLCWWAIKAQSLM